MMKDPNIMLPMPRYNTMLIVLRKTLYIVQTINKYLMWFYETTSSRLYRPHYRMRENIKIGTEEADLHAVDWGKCQPP